MQIAAGEASGMPLFRHLGFGVCNPTLFIYRDSVYKVKGKHPGPLRLRITLIVTYSPPHLLVWVTNQQFLSAEATFRGGLANEN